MVPVRRNQNWLPSIFNDFLGNDWLAERHNTTAPAVNIIEDENEYKVEVAAPGMTKEDFKVHINEDNELIVTMEKKAEQKEEDKKKGTYLRREFSYTKFQQIGNLSQQFLIFLNMPAKGFSHCGNLPAAFLTALLLVNNNIVFPQ